ncbi:hypothetical protein F2981_06315 [Sinorhizobium meliloti]|nr:hypothetical protein [Sinorhizobium meliloti]
MAARCAIRETASVKSLPIAIEVSHHGTAVLRRCCPEPLRTTWCGLAGSAPVVERFNRSSLYMRLLCERNATDFHARYRLPPADFAASGGGVPVRRPERRGSQVPLPSAACRMWKTMRWPCGRWKSSRDTANTMRREAWRDEIGASLQKGSGICTSS